MAVDIIIETIQLKRGTAAEWTSTNPILLDGEAGFETDTRQMKIGDGSSDWASLSYLTTPAEQVTSLVNLTDVGTATPANRHALLGTGTIFNARAITLADISDYSAAGLVSTLDTQLAQTRWKAVEVPAGGTTGQVLKKNSGTNYDVGWANDTAATSAANVTIVDTGAYYTGGDVEAALQEVGASLGADSSSTQTFSNKTIALGSNTVSGSTAEFNTALSDGSFATLAGTETLTNKTINFSNNTVTMTAAQLATAVSDNIPVMTNGGTTYNAGSTQSFQSSATNAGVNHIGVTADPSALNDGDMWYRSDTDTFRVRANTVTETLAYLSDITFTASSTDTLTNKTIDADGTGNVITNIGSSEIKSEMITGFATVTGVSGDFVLISDTSDSGNLKKVDLVDLLAGSSLPVADTTAIVQGSADATKQIRFEVDGLTTATTRVLTVPDADITIAGVNTSNNWSTGQVFSDSGTTPGIRFGGSASDPSTPSDGHIWYNSTSDVVKVRANAITETLAYQSYVDSSTGTGTAFDLSKVTGTFYNMGAANSGTTYTFTGAVTGGWATGLINAASEPTVTSGTKEGGAQFVANTDMYLTIYNNGTATKYYFTAINVGDAAYPAEIGVAVSDETTDLTTGTAKVTFRMPYAMTLNEVRANVNTGGSGGNITIDINESGTSVLSTKLTIDGGTNATGTLTLTANPADTETVTIGSKTYTFQTTLTNVDGNVLIGAAATNSLDNLIAAINVSGGTPGTDYASATTKNTDVSATAGAGDTMDVKALVAGTAANSISTTEGLANGSWGNSTLTGGANPELTSETAATAAVISDSSLADDAEITIDIDSLGTDDKGKGLKVWLIGTRA